MKLQRGSVAGLTFRRLHSKIQAVLRAHTGVWIVVQLYSMTGGLRQGT